MNLVTLVDEYLSEVSRLYQPATELKYKQTLEYLLKDIGEKTPIEIITESDILKSLGRWQGKSKSTQYLMLQIYDNAFKYALEKRYLKASPTMFIKRPKRPRPEDTEVVAITTEEVARMFFHSENWGDEICLGVLAYTGSRRNAVSMLRWRDVDLRPDPPHFPYGGLKLQEKGGKYIEKPIPALLREILDRAPEHDEDDYLVPNMRPWMVTRTERKNDIIYRRIKNIAERAGVKAHVHAIRAAFAVNFLESNRGNIKGLQDLLGHSNIQTTQTYLRKMSKKESMAGVLDLSYGNGALSEAEESRTGADGSNPSTVGDRAVPMPASASLSALSEESGIPAASEVGRGLAGKTLAYTGSSLSALTGSLYQQGNRQETLEAIPVSALTEGEQATPGRGRTLDRLQASPSESAFDVPDMALKPSSHAG